MLNITHNLSCLAKCCCHSVICVFASIVIGFCPPRVEPVLHPPNQHQPVHGVSSRLFSVPIRSEVSNSIDFHLTCATPTAAPGTAAMDSSDAAPPAAMFGVTANTEPAATLPIYTLDSVACVMSLVIRPIKWKTGINTLLVNLWSLSNGRLAPASSWRLWFPVRLLSKSRISRKLFQFKESWELYNSWAFLWELRVGKWGGKKEG